MTFNKLSLSLSICFLFFCSILQAQLPQKMSYQAVIRNSGNFLVTNSPVGLRISILKDSSTGPAVYVETHRPTTNVNGLASIEIGTGTIISGSFSTINWSTGIYYLKTETDPNGGITYTITGTSQLLTVPFAFVADRVLNPAGNNGFNTAIKVTNILSGTYGCRAGGYRIQFGLDSNRNGVLDNAEIIQNLTRNVCNGAVGSQGPAGNGIISTVDNGNGTFTFFYSDGSNFTTGNLSGPAGNNGLDGNGIDTTIDNGNGTFTFQFTDGSTYTSSNLTGPQGPTGPAGPQGPQGQTGPAGIQGINGTNMISSSIIENPGIHCGNGGIKLLFGLDSNFNTTLDSSEVNPNLTRYICNGLNGMPTVVKTTFETAGNNCNTGGYKVEFGPDNNMNQVLDSNEINSNLTQYLCNGQVGSTGATGPQGPIGATGPQGPQGIQGIVGPQGPIGLQGPTGATGAQGPQGIQGPVGQQGPIGLQGISGFNAAVLTTPENQGVNCNTGGYKIEFGTDSNGNGFLDINEINPNLTRYICNGQQGPTGPIGATGPTGPTGATGPQGIQGPIGATGPTGPQGNTGMNAAVRTVAEPNGANCLNGGYKVEFGADLNSNGILEPNEVNGNLTQYICNGQQGLTGPAGATGATGATGPQGNTGMNAAVRTVAEPNGANCLNGGYKVEFGGDLNSNGVLEPNEVNGNLTQYICNGQQGLTGPAGATGATGATGPQGPQGPTGATGATGTQGPQGATGPQGPQGPQGPAGTSGISGSGTNNYLAKWQNGGLINSMFQDNGITTSIGTSPTNQFSLYVYTNQFTSNGDGQHGMYSYRTRDSQNDGTGYGYFNTNSASGTYNYWGDLYTFGAANFNWNDYTRCGGALGAQYSGTYWGSLGYKNSASSTFGVYGSSGYSSGAGYMASQELEGIGGGFFGNFSGSFQSGELFGSIVKGGLIGQYISGNQFTFGKNIELFKNKNGEIKKSYAIQTQKQSQQLSGKIELVNGYARVNYADSEIRTLQNDPIINITAMGETNGLYIAEIDSKGFTIKENKNGKSNVKVCWTAVLQSNESETNMEDEVILDSNFEPNLNEVLFNDGNLKGSALPIWWDGLKIRYDKKENTSVKPKEMK